MRHEWLRSSWRTGMLHSFLLLPHMKGDFLLSLSPTLWTLQQSSLVNYPTTSVIWMRAQPFNCTGTSHSSCLFSMQHASVCRQFIEASKYANFPETACSLQCCPIGSSLFICILLEWPHFSPMPLIIKFPFFISSASSAHSVIHSVPHFLTWLLIILSLPCCS